MARADGTSPCQLFYGRRLRQQLPMTREHLDTQPQDTDGRDKTTRRAEKYRNAHTTKKQDLRPGQIALMQNHLSGKWDRQVEVIRKREKGDSYDVRTDAGKTYVRGRRLLKEKRTDNASPDHNTEASSTPTSPTMPRRSARLNNKRKEEVEVITVRRTKTTYGGQEIKTPATPGGGSKSKGGRGQPDNREQVIGLPHSGDTRSNCCLLYTSPSPRDKRQSRMPSSA